MGEEFLQLDLGELFDVFLDEEDFNQPIHREGSPVAYLRAANAVAQLIGLEPWEVVRELKNEGVFPEDLPLSFGCGVNSFNVMFNVEV